MAATPIGRPSCILSICVCVLIIASLTSSTFVKANNNRVYPNHKYNTNNNFYVASASQQVPVQQQQVSGGYNYPVPPPVQSSASSNRPQTIVRPVAQTQAPAAVVVQPQPQAQQAIKPNVVQTSQSSGTGNVRVSENLDTAAATADDTRQLHAHHSAQLQKIDVACGKERMTVRVTFDQAFTGVIYAKGYYSDPNCRFVNSGPGLSQGQRMYQFELQVGSCGVSFIDSGLTSGGQAYLEGLLVIILEPGVQEAWDAARRIRCLWEGNIDQTVTFPLSVNMLDSQTLTFSGDTASASLEIQTGRGPRAQNVQGLVRIGDILTAVVSVVGDAEFDLLVRNCVATDGTPNNRVVLSDNRGCATKPKLMGGWLKQKNGGSQLSYAYLSAFKFPDVMDLFLECTVSLCKGACEECPTSDYHELHVPNHGHGTETPPVVGITSDDIRTIDARVNANARVKRHSNSSAISPPEESLRLRRVVHVVSPDDFPEFVTNAGAATVGSPSLFGGQSDCFSLLSIMAAVFIALLLVLTGAVVFSLFRRSAAAASHGNEYPNKYYNSSPRP